MPADPIELPGTPSEDGYRRDEVSLRNYEALCLLGRFRLLGFG